MRSSYIGLGLVPDRSAMHAYIVKRRLAGLTDAQIITELVSGKGPCASVTGAVSCDERYAAEMVGSAPKPKPLSFPIVKLALVGLGVLWVVSKVRR